MDREIAIVMTGSNKDLEEWNKIIGNKRHKDELAKQFKDNDSPLKIAIVVDMWLTGFDVPSLATMYIYKPMQGYNLMQAIARVNRVFGDKEGGLVVDYVGIAAALKQALSLCASLAECDLRVEAASFESVRVLVTRLMNQGEGKKISLPEMNARINNLLKASVQSDGVINLFSDIDKEFSLFDPKFLEEVSKMKEKNLAVELLKKLIGEQVIEEILNLAKQIVAAHKEGDQLGLTADELAFYDALTKPQAIKDFYENEELIAITKELADTLRKNRTIDWQKRDSARARMRIMIKRLLKKHRYPPEGMDDAVQTVMTQCELWTDNNDMELSQESSNVYTYSLKPKLSKVAEEPVPYGKQ